MTHVLLVEYWSQARDQRILARNDPSAEVPNRLHIVFSADAQDEMLDWIAEQIDRDCPQHRHFFDRLLKAIGPGIQSAGIPLPSGSKTLDAQIFISKMEVHGS